MYCLVGFVVGREIEKCLEYEWKLKNLLYRRRRRCASHAQIIIKQDVAAVHRRMYFILKLRESMDHCLLRMCKSEQ